MSWVPHGDRRRRRSNVVGGSSPTSTPRWPSRHCTAPGKSLRPSRRPAKRWRCAADRDLRRTRGGGDDRHAHIAECAPRGTSPALKRGPPRRRLVADPPRADPAPHLGDRFTYDSPQRQRHRDRGMAVVPMGRDPARHHREDRVAGRALVAPARDHDPRRRAVRAGRTAELAFAEPVTMQAQPTARGPARGAAVDAGSRSGGLR